MKSFQKIIIKILFFKLIFCYLFLCPCFGQEEISIDMPGEKEVTHSSPVFSQEKEEGIIMDETVEKPGQILPDSDTGVDRQEESPYLQKNFYDNRISEIEIQGNNTVPKETLIACIKSLPGEVPSGESLQKDLQAIFNTGYFTDVKFEPQNSEDGIKIVFRVLENPVVKDIVFTGNELASSEDLMGIMKTRKGEIFNSNDFEEDLKAINDYYDCELGMRGLPGHISEIESPEAGVFLLTVEEGLKVTAIDFSGNTAVSKKELSEVISTKTGEYLNVLSINRDLANISRIYDEKYSLLLDEPLTAEISPEGVLTYIVTEAVIDKIILSGNTGTKDYVVFRELETKEGDLINKAVLSEDIKKLNNLGYFEEVNVYPRPTGKAGHMLLEIEVKETKTGMISAGIGLSEADYEGISGSVSVSEQNLFGTGRNVQVTLERGESVSNYSLNYMEPYITDDGTSLGFSLSYGDFQNQKQSVYNIEDYSYALYRYKGTAGSITLGHPITKSFKLYGGLNITSYDTMATPTEDYPALAELDEGGDIRSLTFSGLYDTRDFYGDPHYGSYCNFYLEQAGLLGGDYDFTKYSVDTRKYFPLGSHTIAFKLMGGTSSGSLPLTKQYYLGGASNLRGYEAGEFTGDSVVLFQAEYRFPILKSKVLQGAVFFDAGHTSLSDFAEGLFNEFKVDEGIGVRLSVPSLGLGTVRFDYAIRNDTGSGCFSIGMGQSF